MFVRETKEEREDGNLIKLSMCTVQLQEFFSTINKHTISPGVK